MEGLIDGGMEVFLFIKLWFCLYSIIINKMIIRLMFLMWFKLELSGWWVGDEFGRKLLKKKYEIEGKIRDG